MRNLWFPYFSLRDDIPPLEVSHAQGSKIYLKNGDFLVDGIASWWAMCHGYQHPHVVDGINKQVSELAHVMFGGLVHEKAKELSIKLIKFLEAKELSRVFFSDSGSTAVEVGMKMAIQYFYENEAPEKNQILYFQDGYHGETFGALSVSDCMKSNFPTISTKVCVKIPTNENELNEFEDFCKNNGAKIAGAIIEPILQGAGGMIISSNLILNKIWNLLKRYNILVIADECATGFYRLGEKFAFKLANFEPDILILGKALSAGHLPFAATVAKEFIFEGICKKSRFQHGPTFMANPTACAASIASIEVFEEKKYSNELSVKEKVRKMTEFFTKEFSGFDARIIGAVCAFKIPKELNLKIKKRVASGEVRAFLRPFGETLYTTPPLNISFSDLKIITEEIKECLNLK